jgi:hypothetical protein
MTSETNRDQLSSAATWMDVLEPQLAAPSAPFRFKVARTLAELEAVYRLRYRIAIAKGWARPEQFPDGLERDAYDARAVSITAWDYGSLVAAARIVLPVPGELLPTEVASGLEIEPRGQVVDLGRVVVAPRSGAPRRRILLGLADEIWSEMRNRGFAVACGSLSRGMARLYRMNGLVVTILGSPQLSWGEDRYPALISIESLQNMAECRFNPSSLP